MPLSELTIRVHATSSALYLQLAQLAPPSLPVVLFVSYRYAVQLMYSQIVFCVGLPGSDETS